MKKLLTETHKTQLLKAYKKSLGTDRKALNKWKRDNKAEFEKAHALHVSSMHLIIEWKKSSTWGYCPTLHGSIFFTDHTSKIIDGYHASGCGYDKGSTVLSDVLNDYLGYLFYTRKKPSNYKTSGKYYGVSFPEFRNSHVNSGYFAGGTGINSILSSCKRAFKGFDFKWMNEKKFDIVDITLS